jgi:hypothetical protein
VFGDNNAANGWAGIFNGNVFATGTYQGSDANLKRDVRIADVGLKQLLKLRPVRYRWSDPARDDVIHLGLIAQEVQAILPQLVRADHDYLSIDYVALVPVVVVAIQEQNRMIERQDARLNALKHGTHISAAPSLRAHAGGVALGFAVPFGLLALGGVLRRRPKETPNR